MSVRRGHDVGQTSLQALNGRNNSGGVSISRHAECGDDEDLHALLDEGLKRRLNCSCTDGVASQGDVQRDAGQHQHLKAEDDVRSGFRYEGVQHRIDAAAYPLE
ncbi:hypothetical protein D3C72_1970610 [compost metagenome]